MLRLEDPTWSRLTTAYGDGAEVAKRLRQLSNDADHAELRQELFELLLHQDTIYTATLAAMPYLAQMAEHTDDMDTVVDLYISGGWIEASREYGEDASDIASSGEFQRERQAELDPATVSEIATGYIEGLQRLSRLYERAIGLGEKVDGAQKKSELEEHPEAVYLLAAKAAYAGHITTARLLLAHPEGDEYAGACPECGEDWYVWQQEDQPEALIVHVDDPVKAVQADVRREPSPIQATSPTKLQPALRALQQKALRLGEQQLAAAILSLDGRVSCPNCRQEVSVWAALTL